MDKNRIVSKINSKIPGAVLDAKRFGRSDAVSLWVEAQSLMKVAELLSSDPDFSVNWLENLTVADLDGCLVITYFLLSTIRPKEQWILRASLVPKDGSQLVFIPSVLSVWPMGAAMEQEAFEMYGVKFENALTPPKSGSILDFEKALSRRLSDDVVGFPLRKKYLK